LTFFTSLVVALSPLIRIAEKLANARTDKFEVIYFPH
jgi:hypothetical protein